MSSWFTSLGTLHHGFGGRWKLGSLAPGEAFDEAVTKAQLDAIAPVPFSASVSAQFELNGVLNGLNFMLNKTTEVPVGQFAPGGVEGLVFYIDFLRGSYWGDITVSCAHPETVESSVEKPTVDQTECNSLVTLTFLEAPEVDDEIVITVTASGGGHSITRTLTINVVADPTATINSITSAEGDLLAWSADIIEAYGNEADELFLEVLVDEEWVTVDTYILLGGGPQTGTISQTSDSGYAAGTYRLKVYGSGGNPIYSEPFFVD